MIRLRPVEPEDLQLLYTIENTPELWDTADTDAPYSKFALKQYIASAQPLRLCGELRMVVELARDGQPPQAIGTVDLTDYNALSARAEIGIALLKEHRAKGHGKEALRQIEELARHWRIHSLHAFVSPGNKASWQLFAHSGYRPVAQIPDWHYAQGKYQEATLFLKIF